MKRIGMLLTAAVVMTACEGAGDPDAAATLDSATVDTGATGQAPAASDSLSIDMANRDGASAGTVQLVQRAGGVEMIVRLTGLTPGEHGFHVHQTAECTPPDFASAGGHLAQPEEQHGLQNPAGPHTGDLPNIRANAEGAVDTTFTVDRVTFRGGEFSLLKPGGSALMVHADPDDYRTDPSGNSGDRVACGVIRE